MVWYNTATVGVLWDEVEVIVWWDDVWVDESAGANVLAILGKETLAGFGVDHDGLEGGTFLFVDVRGFGEEYVDEVLFEELDLVARDRVGEEDNVLGRDLVAIDIGVDKVKDRSASCWELVFETLELDSFGLDWGECWVDRATCCHKGLAVLELAVVDTDKHDVLVFGFSFWNPKGVAALGDYLEQDFGGDALGVFLS